MKNRGYRRVHIHAFSFFLTHGFQRLTTSNRLGTCIIMAEKNIAADAIEVMAQQSIAFIMRGLLFPTRLQPTG